MAYRLGIVLSGGGVRGVAHLGVLAALAERGLEPDCVAGTSSGALVGAFYAASKPIEAALEFFREQSPFRLSRLSLRKPGFIDTEKVQHDLAEHFPDHRFETLDRRLFVVATDIVNAREVVFDTGPLVPAILASCSIPMVFTPTEIDGRLYADGSIVNNFPVEPVKGLCDVVLGSYVGPLEELERGDLDSSLEVLNRALDIGIHFAARRKFFDCEVLLSPPELARYGALETRNIPAIYRIGYEYAQARLDALEAALARCR
jgi:NTE family protein